MYSGRTVFAQLRGYIPFEHFKYLSLKLKSNHGTQSFTAWSHFVCMAYAQFTRREGLRDLVVCLNSQRAKLYHTGIKHAISRATLADDKAARACQRAARPCPQASTVDNSAPLATLQSYTYL